MYRRLCGCLGLLVLLTGGVHADPLGSAFTYQGELKVSNQPANGSYDFLIGLYSVPGGGAALDTATLDDVAVNQGLFSVTLDYTDIPFATSTQYYLELRVRDGASTGAYTLLSPRQPIHATPYAQHAKTVDQAAIIGAAAARPAFATYTITLPGSPTPVAGDSSLTVGVDGLPIASIHDSANGDLLVLHCDDPGCAQRTITTIDSAGIVGRGNSIAITADGLPAISYIDSTNGALKMARCTNVRCTAANVYVVDAAIGDSRRSVITSGTSGALGTADIIYRDEIQGDLESATCTPSGSCTYATIESANNVGRALDAMRVANVLYMAYSDETAGSVKLRSCQFFASACASSPVILLDGAGVAVDIAMVAPPDGRLLIAYVRGTDLRSVRCNSASCASVTAGPVIDGDRSRVSATLGGDGLPVLIALRGDYSGATVLKCVDAACSDRLFGNGLGTSPGLLDARPAVTLGAHGNPVVSHRLMGNLRLLMCDSPECTLARRR